ncbi:MAG: hypothetical protein CGW95_07550 [Phenylobacterium zucineum]|nr:MAG: hypothetical protein CGW95_07550 [Phenylobacterium zucineum]
MHRSGTSAITQLLALAGARLPGNVMPSDEYNEKGYFEPWRISVFNDERLRAAVSAWDDPLTNPGTIPADEPEWRERAIKLFREEYRDAATPLLKDPRVSVLLPLWCPVFEAENVAVQCVIPVRHPLAVAGSLGKRDGFPPLKSILLWMTYMIETERGTRHLPRAFVEYDALLADWRPVVQAMESKLGASLPHLDAKARAAIDDFLTPDLRHNRGDEPLTAFGEIGIAAQGVYDWLIAQARGTGADLNPMQAGHGLIERLRREVGPLISPVSCSNNQALSDLRTSRATLALAQAKIDRLSTTNMNLTKVVESLTRQLTEKVDERREVEGALNALLAVR